MSNFQYWFLLACLYDVSRPALLPDRRRTFLMAVYMVAAVVWFFLESGR